MSNKAKWAIFLAVILWSSAFVGIRAALEGGYSPGALALLRYGVASLCMGAVYFSLPTKTIVAWRDKFALLLIGAVGIGVYNLTLNYGEVGVKSGLASFIISLSPVFTSLFAIAFIRERLNLLHMLGIVISIVGVLCIAVGEEQGFHWTAGLGFILLATLSGSLYSVFNKPFTKNFNIIEVTTYAIWGGFLFLLMFAPNLQSDMHHATLAATATVVYLGIFPAAIGYLAWSAVLTEMSASRAVTFLYYQPFIVTLMGWALLNEVPAKLSMLGGVLAIAGVWCVSQGYKKLKV